MTFMFILGIFVGDRLGFPKPLLMVGLALLLFAFLVRFGLVPHRKRLVPLVRSLLLMATFFSLGLALVLWEKQNLERTFPTEQVAYDAVVVSEPIVRGKVVQCELQVLPQNTKPVLVRTSIFRDTIHHRYKSLRLGDGIRAFSLIETTKKDTAESKQGGFNSQRWLQVHGIAGEIFIYHTNWQKKEVSLRSLSLPKRAKIRLMRFRQKGVEALRASGLDGREQAVVAAMVLGDKSALTKELRQTYSISGASHVLALSGLHLGIIYFLLSFIFVRMGWRFAGQLFTLPIIWIFALMVGFSPSVVRAATMFTVYGLVSMFGRDAFSLNTLAFAAFVMLLFHPLALWDVGFQLSFIAVLGIIVYWRYFYKGMWFLADFVTAGKARKNRVISAVFNWIFGLAAVSFSTQLLTAPLVAYYFGRFSCYFLLTNFVVIPLVTLILYLAAAFFLAIAIESLLGLSLLSVKHFLASLLYRISAWLNGCLEQVASWPGSSIENIRLSSLQTLLIYAFIALISYLLVMLFKAYRNNRLIHMR